MELMKKVSEEEIKETLLSFQMYKIPGPDGWTVEFFLAGYDIIGPDLLQLVEETRVNGILHLPLNSTFLALIPKRITQKVWKTTGLSLCATLITRLSPK